MEKHKRPAPEIEKEEEKEVGKEEKRKPGRPRGRKSDIPPSELKSVKRKKMEMKKKDLAKYRAALNRAIKDAIEIAPTTSMQDKQGDDVDFQSFSEGGINFEFAFKWTHYGGSDEEIDKVLEKVKSVHTTSHLAIPKAIVKIEHILPKTRVEIYTRYKETLRDLLKREHVLPLEKAKNFIHGILDGLAALHAANYIHGDLKPANIAITSNNKIKLIDFGNVTKVKEIVVPTSGNPYYSSDFFTSPKIHEIFSAGCIFLEMLIASWRLSGDRAKREVEIAEGIYKAATLLGDGHALEVTKLMLQRSDRTLTCAKLLEHPFFGGPSIMYDSPTKTKHESQPKATSGGLKLPTLP